VKGLRLDAAPVCLLAFPRGQFSVAAGGFAPQDRRGAARLGWKDTSGNVYKALLVGEPGYKIGDADGAGRVYLYYGPFGPSTASSSYQWALNSPNPQVDAYFGANIVGLKYSSATGDQFAVSARQEDLSGPTVTEAGKVRLYKAN